MKKLLKGLIALGLLLTGCAQNGGSETTVKELSEVKVGVVQLMQHAALDASYEGFKDVLVEAGVKEENIDYQVAGGEQSNCTTISDKLVNDKNDLIYAIATPALTAAMSTTTELPIIGCAVTDYTAYVASNEAPGGNVTGASDLTPVDAQMDLLKELLPEAKKVAILYCSAEDNSIYQGNIAVDSANAKGLTPTVYTVSDTNDIQAVVQKIISDGQEVVYIPTDNLMASNMPAAESLLSPAGIPIIAGEEGMTKAGAYATYGINYYELGKVAGQQALAILKGEATAANTPIAYLPAEGCSKLINVSVAKRCGINVVEDDPNCTYYTEE